MVMQTDRCYGPVCRKSQKMFFTIDSDNDITALDTAPAAQDGLILFATEKEFAKATAEWPINRLVETWNGFAGVPPFGDLKLVKKFTDRNTATGRIWIAIQKLVPAATAASATHETVAAAKVVAQTSKGTAPNAEKKAARRRNAARKSERKPREGTAKAKVIGMLQRKGGATLDAITEATGWQKHSIRGFISILRSKHGMKIESSKREGDGARVYTAR